MILVAYQYSIIEVQGEMGWDKSADSIGQRKTKTAMKGIKEKIMSIKYVSAVAVSSILVCALCAVCCILCFVVFKFDWNFLYLVG